MTLAKDKDWCKHEGDAVLLVEGNNDCHVLLALFQKHKISDVFGIYECGSDDKLLKRVTALLASESPPAILGIVLDADNPNRMAKWESLRKKLSGYSYDFPSAPISEGTILEPDSEKESTRIGIWLMPDNRTDGMLEDLCLGMISPEAQDTVDRCLEIARLAGQTSFKEAHLSKARVHTYLAWQDEPGKPIGQSITSEALNSDTDRTRAFLNWVRLLFGA